MAKSVFSSFCLSIICCIATSQKIHGFPGIINFTNEDYQSGNQNWKIKQDKDGLMYVANNDGLICFDGKGWSLYKLPGNRQLRSIDMGDSGKIFAGGLNELGYFSNTNGRKLVYTSLMNHLPPKEREFGAIWSITVFQDNVFFRSASTIYKWDGKKFISYKNGDWRFLGVVNGALLTQNGDNGLYQFQNSSWVRIGLNKPLPQNARISNIVALDTNKCLIVTQNHGFFILNNNIIVPFINNITNEISNGIVSAAIKTGSKIVIGTRAQGLYILDENLELSEHLTRSVGLHNNHIISLFTDIQSNLWIGLDNGISLVAMGSAIRKIWPDLQDIGAGYAVAAHNNNLYLGTANGLYFAPYILDNNKIRFNDQFKKVNGTKGQVWKLMVVNNKLWMGHHNGAFLIDGANCKLVENRAGYWDFAEDQKEGIAHQSIFGLNYAGIYALEQNSKLSPSLEVEISGGRYFLMFRNMFFVVQQGERILKVDKDNGKNGYSIVNFPTGNDSIEIYHLSAIDQKPVVCTNKGVFEYNDADESFIISETFKSLFGTNYPNYLLQDKNGRIWFILNKKIGYIDLVSNKHVKKFLPELFNKIITDYEQIEALSNEIVIIGSSSGFYTIDLESYNFEKPFNAPKILKVKLLGQKDSTLFEGNGNYKNLHTLNPLKPGWKSIEFQFITPFFADQNNVEYSYLLDGNDKQWSAWNQRSTKEYTNLEPGTYTFRVKSSYNGRISTSETSVAFEVLPAWYQTTLYKFSLIGLVLVTFWQLLRFQHKKAEKKLMREKAEQERLRYLQQLEIDRNEKEIIKLKNEKLEAEINFKNAELASTAMHLVQKGEYIEKFKNELNTLVKMPPSVETKNELNKIIKSLGDNERIDSEWDMFAKHFDQIHKDFLLNVKAKFPQLSPNEIKLCAYIKIDLSTKEIAQLLNISVRGVEISRYRLRKKMDIPNRLTFHTFLSEHGL